MKMRPSTSLRRSRPPFVVIRDRSHLAFGRTNDIDNRSPLSISPDGVHLSCVQTPGRMIHVLSTHRYYRFNMGWLKEPMR